MARRNYVKTVSVARASRRRKVLFVLVVLGLVYALWSFVVGEMGVVKYYRMRSQERSLRAEIEHLKQDNLRLMQDVRSLKHDPAYLERLARDTIGLARPGEVVYFYGDSQSP
jgi:cell division protein FtsB